MTIIAALFIVTVVFALGGLAVDLGSAYARRADAESVADLTAMAAAAKLPDIPAARAKALEIMCSAGNALQGWPSWVCDGSRTWYSDGSTTNGEINFFTEDANNNGAFDPAEMIPNGPGTNARTDAVALRVILPPATVKFAFAAGFGNPSGQVTARGTARIGTPAGMGVLPFGVEAADLSATDRNRFCVLDGADNTGGWTGPLPARRNQAPNITFAPAVIAPGGVFVITRTNLTGNTLPTSSIVVHFHRNASTNPSLTTGLTSTGATILVNTTSLSLTAGTYTVWASGTIGRRNVTSWTATLTVTGTPASTDPCDRPDAGRGLLEIARTGAVGDLERDVKAGVDPDVHAVQDYPLPALTITPAVSALLPSVMNCGPLAASPVVRTIGRARRAATAAT